MTTAPAVRARLDERFVLNFRISPDALERHLLVPWLEPQVIHGYGVVSLCILHLSHITVAPLPGIAPFRSICWAYRYGVIDHSVPGGRPAVYVRERLTDSLLIGWTGPRLFTTAFPRSRVSCTVSGSGQTNFYATGSGRKVALAARVSRATASPSALFNTVGAFERFIKEGVVSYTPCTRHNRLVRIDLLKEEMQYEPLEVRFCDASILHEWKRADPVVDSAFRTRGGHYEWQYREEVPIGTSIDRIASIAA